MFQRLRRNVKKSRSLDELDDSSHPNNNDVLQPSNEQGPSPRMPSITSVSNQKPQKARMSSMTKATTNQGPPWKLNATEQEIVRARHYQFMSEQIAAQQEAHAAAARNGGSPSQQSQSPSPRLQERQQSPQPPISAAQFARGFRKVLPKTSPLSII
jgi:hypothetical protein